MACFPQTLEKALKGGGSLKLECRKVSCGHTVTLPARQALKLFGESATPLEVQRRVYCKVCGGRDVKASA